MRKSFRVDGIEIFVDPKQDLVIDQFRGIFVHKTHAKCRKELDLVIAYKYLEEQGYSIMREVLSSGDLEGIMDEYFDKLKVASAGKVVENIERLPSDFRRSVLYYLARRTTELPNDLDAALRNRFISFFRSYPNGSASGIPI